MKATRRSIWLALVVALLLILTGCSSSQQELFNAAMKTRDVNSVQQHTTMTFELKGSGFEPSIQQQIDMAAAFLKDAKLEFDVKASTNDQKTAAKSQVTIDLALQGMDITMPIWVDSDLTGDTPKVIEIIKIPQIAKESLPPQFAGKDYVVLDLLNMDNSGANNMDMTKLMEFSKNYQEKELKFLSSYSKRFKPNVDTVGNSTHYMQTDDGLKLVRSYQLRLDDAQFKEFIRYAVNNMLQDEEALEFVKEFMETVLEMSQVPDEAKSLSDMDQVLKDFDAKAFLVSFNSVMDQLEEVTLLGDQGLKLEYTIYDGYFIKKSGAINLQIDIAQLNQLMNTLNGQESTPIEAQGIVDMMINYSTDISGINQPLEIEFPEVNPINSFDYKTP